MRVQSTSSQANEPSHSQAAPHGQPSAGPGASLAVFDASGHPSSTIDSRAGGEPRTDTAANGVARDDKGQAFIRQGAQTYPVSYDKDNGTWRVFNPENPTKYQYPVRQDSSGIWRTHGDVGLPGGLKGDANEQRVTAQRIALLEQRIPQLESRLQQVIAQQEANNVYWHAAYARLQAASPNQSSGESERQWREMNVRSGELRNQRLGLEQELNQLRGELQQLRQ